MIDTFGDRVRTVADSDLLEATRLENTLPGHNKEYTYTLVKTRRTADPLTGLGGPEYVVTGAWGVIGGSLTKQEKLRVPSFSSAKAEYSRLVSSKKVKGYKVVAMEEHEPSLTDVWSPTDDPLLGLDDLEAEDSIPKIIEPPDDCACYKHLEALGNSAYAEPLPPDTSTLPFFSRPGFALLRMAATEPAPRWLVGTKDTCTPGYPHMRAFPLGPDVVPKDKTLTRSKPGFIAGLAGRAVRPSTKGVAPAGFALVVEEIVDHLQAVDALQWNGEDLSDKTFFERRQTFEAGWGDVFMEDAHLRIAPIVTTGLRETFLDEGEETRFELVELNAKDRVWELPLLKETA